MNECDGFAPIYDAWSAAPTDDVDFYVDLALEADGHVDRRPLDEASRELVWIARKPA